MGAAAVVKEHVRDERHGYVVVGSVDELDRVSGAHRTGYDDREVGARTPGTGEAPREQWVGVAQPELEARQPRLADLQHRAADRPPLADSRPAHVDAAQREVLAEGAGTKWSTELPLPPGRVLERVRVDGLVRTAVNGPVGLIVASQVHSLERDGSCDRVLPDRGRDRALSDTDRTDLADIDALDVHVLFDAAPCAGLTEVRLRRARTPMDMTFRRSRAYGRVIRALESPSALTRLTPERRNTLREAADTLVLSRTGDSEAWAALASARAVLLGIRGDKLEQWVEQLADDFQDAGPDPLNPVPASTGSASSKPVQEVKGSACR
jgi:hypothetical protein